jgi:hypothetical protein
MIDVSTDQLKTAVESQHGGTATLVQSVPVHETFKSETVWDGIVHIFDLSGHPTAKRATHGPTSAMTANAESALCCTGARSWDRMML